MGGTAEIGHLALDQEIAAIARETDYRGVRDSSRVVRTMELMNEEADPLPEPVLRDRFADAFAHAVQLHALQARKGTAIPYVTHLMSVCSLVLEDGGDEDQAVAALLHDGPEDQGGQPVLDEIRRRFGDEVATLVIGLTDTLETPKPEWRPRKTDYLARLEDEPISVLRVSLADKLHNLRSMATDAALVGDEVWGRFNADREQQAWYFGALLDVFERRLPDSRNLPEFRRLVGEVFAR
jgi:(p)ppGpp synthase/HD superfamily hydrolase